MRSSDFNSELGKIPPQAIELEEAILGALLIDPDITDQVLSLLPEGSFYTDAHNVIYSSVKKIYGRGGAIDILTVTQELRKEDQLDRCGGVMSISKLTSNVASGLHATEHAAIVLEQYIKRCAIRIAGNLTKAAFDEGTDAEDIIRKLFASVNELQAMMLSNKRGNTLSEVLDLSIADYYERKKLHSTGETLGIKTPLKVIDEYTNGWQNGDLIIIAARPSMGKTAFAISSLTEGGRQGKRGVFFSIEMMNKKIGDRILIGEAMIDPMRYRSGTLLDSDEQKLEPTLGRLSSLQAIIDDSPRQTVADIWGKCRILKNREKCDFVIIDYVGLVSSIKDKGKSREQEVSEISASLKMMAKDLDIPVILLSQLNRGVELRQDKRPKLSDLRESGSLEQDSDVVIMLYRDEYYNSGQKVGVGEAIIAKNRNGNTGLVEFYYNSSLTRIYDQEEVKVDKDPFVDN